MSNALKSKFDESPGIGEKETKMSMEVDQPSYSEDDEELTESKIEAFLDEKVLHAHIILHLSFSSLHLYENHFMSITNVAVNILIVGCRPKKVTDASI